MKLAQIQIHSKDKLISKSMLFSILVEDITTCLRTIIKSLQLMVEKASQPPTHTQN